MPGTSPKSRDVPYSLRDTPPMFGNVAYKLRDAPTKFKDVPPKFMGRTPHSTVHIFNTDTKDQRTMSSRCAAFIFLPENLQYSAVQCCAVNCTVQNL